MGTWTFWSNKKRDFWRGLHKFLAFTAKQIIHLTAFIAEVFRKLIEGVVALLGSNSFSFFAWSIATVVALIVSITGFPEMASIVLKAVGIKANDGVVTFLLALGAGLNYVQLQPRLWKYWQNAAGRELGTNPNYRVKREKLTPLHTFLYSFNLAVSRKNRASELAYMVESLFYVASGVALLIAGNPIGAILLYIAKSVVFLYTPELFLGMAFAMRTISEQEKNPTFLPEDYYHTRKDIEYQRQSTKYDVR